MARVTPRLGPGSFLLTVLIVLTGCGEGGGTVVTSMMVPPSPSMCPLAAAPTVLVTVPMTQPPAGSTGVSTTVGSITVPLGPQPDHLIGVTVNLFPAVGAEVIGGVFAASGSSSLTATVPKLQPNTTYTTFANGEPCGPFFTFGQFTTGAT